jgi:hypothetical protein
LFVCVLVSVLLGLRPVGAAPAAEAKRWWGEYFDNRTLSGGPVVSRFDDAINFTWGDGAPASGVPKDNFSVRWTRDEWFAGGTYRFVIYSDDGVRLWIGDQLIVDQWHDRWAEPLVVDHYVPQGTHRAKVEYYDHTGTATISVVWDRLEANEGGWRGEYFDNRELEGWPTMTRNDPAIDFDWGAGSPGGGVPADDFSVRWTHNLNFRAGTYRFYAATDDGVRVWVDGQLVIDAWRDQMLPKTHTGDRYLAAGQHAIKVEYYEHGGEASAHVWWEPLDGFGAWKGEYFDNRQLTGGPVLVRDDARIDFDWGVEPPIPSMPDDNFSARWTRTLNFPAGYYRFVVQADDGVRVWLDGSPIIDKWQDMEYELHYVDGTYLTGAHTLKVEYYERTGDARVRFWIERGTDGNAPPTYTPAGLSGATTVAAPAALAPAAPTAGDPDDPWEAAYFDNVDLAGEPVLTRIETSLRHDWRFGSPGAGVPKDKFSARWTQPLFFEGGRYRFTTYTDDGVRLWVDGELLIDSWRPMRGYRSATVRLSEGVHEVRMEYYERYGIALARLTWLRVGR